MFTNLLYACDSLYSDTKKKNVVFFIGAACFSQLLLWQKLRHGACSPAGIEGYMLYDTSMLYLGVAQT